VKARDARHTLSMLFGVRSPPPQRTSLKYARSGDVQGRAGKSAESRIESKTQGSFNDSVSIETALGTIAYRDMVLAR